jgi:hypothetical protein
MSERREWRAGTSSPSHVALMRSSRSSWTAGMYLKLEEANQEELFYDKRCVTGMVNRKRSESWETRCAPRCETKNLCVASARFVACSKNKRSLLRDAGSRRKQNAENWEHVVSARSVACNKNIQMSGPRDASTRGRQNVACENLWHCGEFVASARVARSENKLSRLRDALGRKQNVAG